MMCVRFCTTILFLLLNSVSLQPSDIMSEKDALEVKDAMESFLYEKSDLHLDKVESPSQILSKLADNSSQISLADFDRALSEHLLSVNPNRRTRNYAG